MYLLINAIKISQNFTYILGSILRMNCQTNEIEFFVKLKKQMRNKLHKDGVRPNSDTMLMLKLVNCNMFLLIFLSENIQSNL